MLARARGRALSEMVTSTSRRATRWARARGVAAASTTVDGTVDATARAPNAASPRDVLVTSFAVDASTARRAMARWLGASASRPRNVRGVDGSRDATYRAAYAPYWVFDVSAEVDAVGSVCVEGNWVRSGTGARVERFGVAHEASQICASFARRRDLVDVLRPGASVNLDEGMSYETFRDRVPTGVEIEPFEMHRSMALSLATGRMRDHVREAAKKTLTEKHPGSTAATDVVVDFATLNRKLYAVYHPVWYVSFAHGSVVDDETNKIICQPREAIVCGVTGVVVSEDLICDNKARALAFGAFAIPAACAAYLMPDSAFIILAQGAVASAVAVSGAGVVVRQVPKLRQDEVDSERIRDEDRAFSRSNRASGGAGWMDESVQRSRDDAEWRRWKETDKAQWIGEKRRAWAYNILEGQVFRFRERQELRHEMEERAAREDDAARRAAEKRRRYGDIDEDEDAHRAPSGRHPGFSRDVHGFYKILRLDGRLGLATELEIKAAFRTVALETHPDKVDGDERAKRRAAERFHLAQKAYATLGNKNTRSAYDRK